MKNHFCRRNKSQAFIENWLSSINRRSFSQLVNVIPGKAFLTTFPRKAAKVFGLCMFVREWGNSIRNLISNSSRKRLSVLFSTTTVLKKRANLFRTASFIRLSVFDLAFSTADITAIGTASASNTKISVSIQKFTDYWLLKQWICENIVGLAEPFLASVFQTNGQNDSLDFP